MLFSPTYQGNLWWGFMAILGVLLLGWVLLESRRKHRAGEPVKPGDLIRACLACLLFIGVAIYQVLTHR